MSTFARAWIGAAVLLGICWGAIGVISTWLLLENYTGTLLALPAFVVVLLGGSLFVLAWLILLLVFFMLGLGVYGLGLNVRKPGNDEEAGA